MVEDKIGMAYSLESRFPFLDNDLVDFSMSIPVSMKLGNLSEVVRLNENEAGHKTEKYFQKTRDGKLILRNSMDRFLPDGISRQVKQGFSAPDGSWYKGESLEFVRRSIISNKKARIYDFMDYASIRELLDEHMNGLRNRRLLIWSLLNTEEMLNCFFP